MKVPIKLAALCKLAARESSGRLASLAAVRLRETADGCEAVVSDGKRLAVVRWPDAPDELRHDLEEDGGHEALVPAAELARLLKAAPKRGRAQAAFVGLGEHQAHFAVGNAVEFVPCAAGPFPNVEAVAEQQHFLFHLAVDARLLAELLLVAAEFAGDYSVRADLHFQGKDKPLLVTARDGDGTHFQAVLVPLTVPKPAGPAAVGGPTYPRPFPPKG
jgi:hypothetical protein